MDPRGIEKCPRSWAQGPLGEVYVGWLTEHRPMQITPEAIQDFRIGDLSAGAVDPDETAPDTSTGRPGHLPCEQLWIQRIIYGLGHYQGLFAAEAAGSREDRVLYQYD
ncbi:hypothetical protein ABT299_22515 [Spirillospora sp. NPDC000708]